MDRVDGTGGEKPRGCKDLNCQKESAGVQALADNFMKSACRLCATPWRAKRAVALLSQVEPRKMFEGNKGGCSPLRLGPRVDNNKTVHTTKVRIEVRFPDLRRNPLKVTKGVQPGSGKFRLNFSCPGFIPLNPQTGCTCRTSRGGTGR